MGDFNAKASAKRVIHRNAHSIGISGRPRRVNPPDFARPVRKCPAIASICREGVDIPSRRGFIHWQKMTIRLFFAIIHSHKPVRWRIHDNAGTDSARVHRA
ncbi:hypothetical protein [Pandoraea pnomenusa]|uniref:hypothetical protein n=1 Tax=Pandoraea pnomenusa TaxID=93220 RepID=UPI00333FB013